MKLLRRLVRKTINIMPRSNALLSACHAYCQRFQEPGYENNDDMHTNGEVRLLEEVAGDIRIAFDVGANVGEWTALLLPRARQLSHVHAFEPSRSTYDKFRRRAFPSCVSLYHMGFSSSPGKANLYVIADADPGNSLYQRQGLEQGWGIDPPDVTEEVELESIDRFCEKQNLENVDFVKIDAEGHEVDIIQGATRSLQNGVLKIIQFEYGGTYIDSRKLLKDIFEIVADLDYCIFLLAPDRLIFCPRYDQRLENFQYKNFAIFHRDAIERSPSARQAYMEFPNS